MRLQTIKEKTGRDHGVRNNDRNNDHAAEIQNRRLEKAIENNNNKSGMES